MLNRRYRLRIVILIAIIMLFLVIAGATLVIASLINKPTYTWPETQVEEAAIWSIEPGVGVGPIKFGMSLEEVEAILGPVERYKIGTLTDYQFKSKGLAIWLTSSSAVSGIIFWCVECEEGSPRLERMPWKTEEGVGIGSTESEIVDALGMPTNVRIMKTKGSFKRLFIPDSVRWLTYSGTQNGRIWHLTFELGKNATVIRINSTLR